MRTTWPLKEAFQIACALALCLGASRRVDAQPIEWRELKGDHFILHQEGDSRSFGDRVLHQAEGYYDEIARALGYSRRGDFWLWEDRCNIYVYESRESFLKATKQPEWSSGFANLKRRMIVTYEDAPEFLNSLLPHELAHLIFRDFVGVETGEVPLWLDEGMAMAQEKAKREQMDQVVSALVAGESWLPLEKLSEIRKIKSYSPEQALAFYAQAQSIVRFLLETSEGGRFLGFCRNLRDGETLEEALRKNYPKEFTSIQALEHQWLDGIRGRGVS
jgi:hypothetical protein